MSGSWLNHAAAFAVRAEIVGLSGWEESRAINCSSSNYATVVLKNEVQSQNPQTSMFRLRGDRVASAPFSEVGMGSKQRKVRETGAPATALRRLVEALVARGVRVELRKRDGKQTIILEREGWRRVAYSPHRAERNFELLEAIALLSPQIGGAGMSRSEVAESTGYSQAARDEAKERRRIRRALKRAEA